MGDCDICDGDNNISYTCNECGGTFCSSHRLPESHNCQALRTRDFDEAWFKDELSVRDNHHRSETARVHDDSDDEGDEYSSPEPMSVEDIRENKKPTSSDDSNDEDKDDERQDDDSHETNDTEESEKACIECGRITQRNCERCGGRYCVHHKSPRVHDCPAFNVSETDSDSSESEQQKQHQSSRTPPKPDLREGSESDTGLLSTAWAWLRRF